MQPRTHVLGAALLALAGLGGCPSEPPAPPPSPKEAPAPLAKDTPPPERAPDPSPSEETPRDKDGLAPAVKPPLPPKKAEQAPPPSPRTDVKEAEVLRAKVESYFQSHVGRRVYIQTDKPLYRPGETVWIKLWDLVTRSFGGDHGAGGMIVELVSPRGAVVTRRRVREQGGAAQADLPLTEGMSGGEYTLRARTFDGQSAERQIIVSSYEAPRLKLKLEFLRKAYGAGDEVSATIAVHRATGEPLRNHPLSALVRLDGEDLPRVPLSTDSDGEGVVRFQLPARIAVGDGLLTVLAEDGGLTESVQKRVPIIVNRLSLSTFPEGGHLVEGLPGRVYFEARNPLGKPADISGRVVDDGGKIVAQFASVRDGLGRFDIIPSPGRSYHIEIDRPVGLGERYPLPPPLVSGCVLRSFDDLDGEFAELRVSVRCSEPRRVIVSAMLRERFIDAAAVDVPGGAPAIVYLAHKGADGALLRAQGVARVTLFDDKLIPLAERLVYRNRRARLGIQVEPRRKSYSPRDKVVLALRTTDPSGQPVPAALALSVVDDTVLSFADDKSGHMLSRLYLEPELPGKVEEPNFYFDLGEEKSALGMDLLMGTRGYRRFEWQPVLGPREGQGRGERFADGKGADPAAGDFGGLKKKRAAASPVAPPAPPTDPDMPVLADKNKVDRPAPLQVAKAPSRRHAAPPPQPEPSAPSKETARAAAPPRDVAATRAAPLQAARPLMRPGAMGAARPAREQAAAAMDAMGMEMEEERPRERPREQKAEIARGDLAEGLGAAGAIAPGRGKVARLVRARPPAVEWAPVRVFPAPIYQPGYEGPRTDFRDTLWFQPSILTDQEGRAEVSFYLSDAITSFRVLTEGTGAGEVGRDETIVKSSLPFSMAVKVPLEVSEGDHIELPLQLANEREGPLVVDLKASFGDLLRLDRKVERTRGTLAAGAREALFYPLTVSGKRGRSKVRFLASASGLTDEFEREVLVSPRGFPQHFAKSGQLKEGERLTLELDLGEMLPGTAEGKVRLYPSPVASMVAGLEGMLQEPGGCFEQASSTNYPNVMILQYLKQQRHLDAGLMGRASQLLDIGYRRLIGYETPQRGYEWFGSAPGHEALTAYGLLEFTDMKEVYGDVDREMLRRTAAWLRSRRDGKGGYLRDAKALDSFGRASKEVTDAYITYSLAEARQSGIDAEIDAAARTARDTDDAYLLALSSNSLLAYGRRDAGLAAVKRLVSMQDASGGFLRAGHSITRSGGESLYIETTALALLALLRAGEQDEPVRRAVEWLMSHRGGYGQWGATQSTVLALKALTAYAIASRRTQAPGDVTLLVNGQVAAREHYEAGRRAPIILSDFARSLKPGKNRIELVHEGKAPLPFSAGIDYRSQRPASSPQAVVGLETALERAQLGLGESVRMNVTVRNRKDAGQPMTLVRVGLPGGLTHQTWQLKELRDKGTIAFYETGPREVNLYLREMKPHEEVHIPLDLMAVVPGSYTAPASRAYLYYTSEHKTWVDGTRVKITP